MNATETTIFDLKIESLQSTIAKDLRINFRRITEESSLKHDEAFWACLALATATDYSALKVFARQQLVELGVSAEQIQEAEESSAIMAMLNTYYRFRHMIGNSDDYNVAGLRMTSLARPALGKEHFEMLAFALSVLNGCESCIRSHEQVLRNHGIDSGKIHDLARLASVVRALKTLSSGTPKL